MAVESKIMMHVQYTHLPPSYTFCNSYKLVFDVCLDQQEEVPSVSPAAAPKHTWFMFLVMRLRFILIYVFLTIRHMNSDNHQI